jgi:hypothetical protein
MKNSDSGDEEVEECKLELTLSAEPVRRRCSLLGAKAMALIGALCALVVE